MDETDGTEQVPYTRVTVAEAAAILGVNVVTIRRMIKRGQLEAERVHRPQGSAYLVKLPGDGAGDATPTEQVAQDMSRTQGTPTPPAEAMVSLIQATIGTVLAPLVAELAASRQTIERQAERQVALQEEHQREATKQAELIGAQRAELALLRAEVKTLTAQMSPLEAPMALESVGPTQEPSPARWRALLPWLFVTALLALTVVGLVWSR